MLDTSTPRFEHVDWAVGSEAWSSSNFEPTTAGPLDLLAMRQLGYVQWVIAITLAAASTLAYQVPVSDKDDTRQTCSGMYGGSVSHINGAQLSSPCV